VSLEEEVCVQLYGSITSFGVGVWGKVLMPIVRIVSEAVGTPHPACCLESLLGSVGLLGLNQEIDVPHGPFDEPGVCGVGHRGPLQ